MVKAIIFDLDDTLLWDKKSVAESFRATCNMARDVYPQIDPERLEQNVRTEARALYASFPTYAFTQMIGINPFEGLWGDFDDGGREFDKLQQIAPEYRKSAWKRGLEKTGFLDEQLAETLAEAFPKVRKQKPIVFSSTFKVLNALRADYKLGLLTNGSPSLQQTKLDMTPQLKPYFDEIVVSGAFGSGKPDPAIFQHMLEKLEVDASEAVMVGDNLNTDIVGAFKSEMASIWINWNHIDSNECPTFEVDDLLQVLDVVYNRLGKAKGTFKI
ncbi:HAD family hydrolase [Virgibacillus chiguensis]|uniref:Phosphoserine phosphatase n=1 Tax=Virgibacillus chiguensis TaxID=411959 RepID=A0A1M5PHP4_9BACI|nr:HAD family hydrolase [Virgibacillus chiguensis]SHH01260.1 putative hydrolase of the HAD superfamily [Virgibacillus chiguensis]